MSSEKGFKCFNTSMLFENSIYFLVHFNPCLSSTDGLMDVEGSYCSWSAFLPDQDRLEQQVESRQQSKKPLARRYWEQILEQEWILEENPSQKSQEQCWVKKALKDKAAELMDPKETMSGTVAVEAEEHTRRTILAGGYSEQGMDMEQDWYSNPKTPVTQAVAVVAILELLVSEATVLLLQHQAVHTLSEHNQEKDVVVVVDHTLVFPSQDSFLGPQGHGISCVGEPLEFQSMPG